MFVKKSFLSHISFFRIFILKISRSGALKRDAFNRFFELISGSLKKQVKYLKAKNRRPHKKGIHPDMMSLEFYLYKTSAPLNLKLWSLANPSSQLVNTRLNKIIVKMKVRKNTNE
jgi:hypothetical protein